MSIYSLVKSLCNPWEAYDPSWLVQLAREQIPEEPWLSEALSRCTVAKGADSAYIAFVDQVRPNQPGSDWQFDKNIILEHHIEGDLVIDVLKGSRIGGVEVLKKLSDRN